MDVDRLWRTVYWLWPDDRELRLDVFEFLLQEMSK